jgi:hypothetical protein
MVALIAALASTAPASAQGLFRAADLQVVDSTGKQVGTLSHSAFDAFLHAEVVLRTDAGKTVFVDVYRSALVGNAQLYFSQPQCAGGPALTPNWSKAKPSSAIIGPRQTVFVQTGAFTRMTMRSIMRPNGRCVDLAAPKVGQFAPAQNVAIDLADYFTPPFDLRATPGVPIPAGNVGPQRLDPTDRIFVRDATGKKVAAAHAYAVMTDSGVTIPMSGLHDEDNQNALVFESTDCTGPPFVWGSEFGSLRMPVLVGPRRSVWVRSDEESRTMYSASNGADNCVPLETVWGPGPSNRRPGLRGLFAPATPVGIDLDDYFTWPFNVRAGGGTRVLPPPTN